MKCLQSPMTGLLHCCKPIKSSWRATYTSQPCQAFKSTCAKPYLIEQDPGNPRVSNSLVQRRGASTSSDDTSASKELLESQHTSTAKLSDSRAQNVFSLIQPTGIPHLGNFLGALRLWKDFQDDKMKSRIDSHRLDFGIADLHSLTLRQSSSLRHLQIRQSFAALMAIGLDLSRSNLFVQSQLRYPAELMWYLSTVTPFGHLSRMTQWKDKTGIQADANIEDLDEKARDKLKLALFSYPVLQAADILLFDADIVPIGEDQLQHVELTRRLARSFNSIHAQDHSPLLKLPSALVSPAKRVMSLQDPKKKMSKSDPDERSRVLITDKPDVIRSKFRAAKTDSFQGVTYDREQRPGVANLIEIYVHTTRSTKTFDQVAAEFSSLKDLKDAVATSVICELDGVEERFSGLLEPDNRTLQDAMAEGRKQAVARTEGTMERIRQALGLLPELPPFEAH